MGNIIDGRFIATAYKNEIKDFVAHKVNCNERPPKMATILVGEDGGSIYYVKNQTKLCEELGIVVENILLGQNTSEETLIGVIKKLNDDESVDGIMLQVPLPKHIDEKRVTSIINPKKDIDGITDINTGKFYRGDQCFIPCTPKAIMEILNFIGFELSGKRAVVLGRSNIVGKPVAQLLLNKNATVTICHSKTENLKAVCREADVLVVAIGRAGFLTSEYVKEGAVVIDVGTSMVEGKIKGDVYFDEVIEKASLVTPVPGGVGAMTTTMLLKNLCEARK